MLERWAAGFDWLLERLAMLFVIVLLGTVTAGIVSRAAGHPFSFTDEASGFLMVWLACIGWMLATRRGVHIRIRFFLERLPGGSRRGTEMAIHVGAVIFGAVIAWKSLHLIEVNSDVDATTMPIATAWMYVPLLPAGLATLVQALADLRRSVLRGASEASI